MISLKGLTIANTDEILISKLNISFKTGEFWAILGKNGSGKTSLLNTMAGFLDCKQGSITIDNQEISALDSLSKAQKIAFLPQLMEASLDCTVAQSIAYGRYPWHKNSEKKVQDKNIIDGVIEQMQLESIQHKSIQQISGGELRKVELATVLAQDSEIMMLDEPLNHLDISMRHKLMEYLQKLIKNKTIIMVTHDIQYVQQYCSHVLMLLDDTKVKFGSVAQMMTADNLNKNLGVPITQIPIN